MRKPIIKKGDKYGRLTAIRFDHKRRSHQCWLFRCDCGNKKVIEVAKVKSGHTKSCGCLQQEKMTTHGMTYSKEYNSWVGMKQRCLNKNHSSYKDYGGRGITICKRWLKFENFFADMGEKPEGTSIDRIDNNGNYEPSNCKWATQKQQNNNMRRNHLLTYKNRTMTMSQWAKEMGINYKTLKTRIWRGWSAEKALNNN